MTILTLMLILDPRPVALPGSTATSAVPGCFAKVGDLKRIEFGSDRETPVATFEPAKVRELLAITF